MVLGRAGVRLEAQKFALYLIVPITASLLYNEPTVQKVSADYFQFMKYPSNPKTNLKEEFEQLQRENEEQKEMDAKRKRGRQEYLEQLKKLNSPRVNADRRDSDSSNDNSSSGRGWFSWWRSDPGKDSDIKSQSQ